MLKVFLWLLCTVIGAAFSLTLWWGGIPLTYLFVFGPICGIIIYRDLRNDYNGDKTIVTPGGTVWFALPKLKPTDRLYQYLLKNIPNKN